MKKWIIGCNCSNSFFGNRSERAARTNIKCYKEGEIYCYYNGIKNFKEIKTAIEQRIARLLFISPEALIKNEQFSELISKANMDRYLKNIIIDEAHIVVAWGTFSELIISV